MATKPTRNLTAKQKQAIPIILSAETISEGCKLAGITRHRYYDWLKKPEFKKEVRKQNAEIIDEALSGLKKASAKATKTLTNLLESEDESIQLRTSQTILDFMLKFREIDEVIERIEKLEKAVDNG